jgi:ubiquinone/menaquinone biosynthesis C-methylase UbiE
MHSLLRLAMVLGIACGLWRFPTASAQEKSVKPGINKNFENPDVEDFVQKFEGESREIAGRAKEIVAAVGIKPGMSIADVGAGTGLFTRKFAAEVGPQGKVFAVDISPKFLRHIEQSCAAAGVKNVETLQGDQFSTRLPKNSVDLVFICDTYHHFEFPQRTLKSIYEALRPAGKLILIDFHRIEGKSSAFILGHVRAGQEVFVQEVVEAGFKQVGEERELLQENYFVRFEKQPEVAARGAALSPIVVTRDQRGFVAETTGEPFVPWGFNYDHDVAGRLIEDYWDQEWPLVADHFAQMRKLGANVVRVHLQFGKFMATPREAHPQALERLQKLLQLAEQNRLYLDLTGLGCYHKAAVPDWYDQLAEEERWEAQGHFWRAVAKTCADSPAVFCYDLMNEPTVPGGKRAAGDWLGPPFAGKHFVQFVTLDQRDRPRPEIARQWIQQLVSAIRDVDRRHLITVGLVDWSLDRPGLTSGFVPRQIAPELDFLCVHLYPESGKIEAALETLAGFSIGKPVVIEEMFPLKCTPVEFEQFLQKSKPQAQGWIGFYWGQTPDELRQTKTIGAALTLGWLELFQKHAQSMTAPGN